MEEEIKIKKKKKNKLGIGGKIIVGLLVIFFLFIIYIAIDANKYSAMVHVIEGEGKVGVNPTTESLDFGDLSPGTSAVRKVTVNNGTGMSMYIVVWKTGEIKDLMSISDNFFTLSGGEEKQIEFPLYMPASGEIGETYKGRVFLFKIPTF